MTIDNATPEIAYSVCPHDCPSTRALVVERLDVRTIGRMRGARDNSYTAGVVCATARPLYSERVHHPDDMAAPGIDDGDRVGVGNRRGDILVHASCFADMQPGAVIVESVWSNNSYEEGLGVSALIGADAAPPPGSAVFRDSAVWLRSA